MCVVCFVGEKEIMKKIKDLERTEKERVVIYSVDVLNYRSIVDALKGCCGLFCSLDSPDGYDVSYFIHFFH